MKRNYFRLFVVFFGAALLSAVAFATVDTDRLIVNIPYNFVASGKTLPAGKYTVQRVNDYNRFPLAITSVEDRGTVFVLANEVEDEVSRTAPGVTFLVAGDQHFLTKIRTAEHSFSFPVSAAAVQSANQRSFVTGTSESSHQ